MQKRFDLNPAKCSFEKRIYLGSIIDHSAITCDWIKVDEETKTITINFNEEKVPQNLYNLLTFIN